MDKKLLTLEEAEDIVDNMYQKRWVECGIKDGNTIYMGNLDKLHYSELERASILLLITELRLKKENKKLKNSINKAVEIIRNDWNYDDNDFEGRRFQKDILKALGVDYNDVW